MLKKIVSSFKSSAPFAEARRELTDLKNLAHAKNEPFLSVDLKCLARFNQLLSDLMKSQNDDQAGWETLRTKLVNTIAEFPNGSFVVKAVDVPDLPLAHPASPCGYVRAMDAQPGSADIDCQKVLNLDGTSMPEFAELSGLVFWLETLRPGLGIGTTYAVRLERATVVPPSPAAPAAAQKDPDQPD